MSDPTTQQLADRAAIVELVYRYSDAVTRKDREQWAATWAEDGHWNLGQDRVMDGRDAIVDYWVSAVAKLTIAIQLAHNGTVAFAGSGGDSGDRASGRWYISEHIERADGERALFLAWYDDTYRRVDGAWRFASRSIVVLYRGAPDLSGAFADVASLPPRG